MISGREGGRTRVKCILHQGAYELVSSREYVEEITSTKWARIHTVLARYVLYEDVG